MRLVTATGFLAAINIVGSLVGFIQGVLVAKYLGPEQLGVVAVVVAIAAISANLVDIRVGDLLAKIFYAEDSQTGEYKAAIFRMSVVVQLVPSSLVFVLVYIFGSSGYRIFTERHVHDASFAYIGMGYALIYFSGLFLYLQRFMESYILMGLGQLFVSLCTAIIVVSAVAYDPSVDGYARGLFFSALISALISISLCAYLWMKKGGVPLFRSVRLKVWERFSENFHLLIKMKFMGFAKLLHRAADVLLVGLFCNDQQTGVYKLARSLTDSFYLIFDAVNKVVHPRLYTWIKECEFRNYRLVMRKIFIWSLVLTAGIILLELLYLDEFVRVAFGGRYSEVEFSIIFLTVPLFFALGLHTWLWPLLVKRGGVGRYALFYAISIVVGQYFMAIVFYFYFGAREAVWFAFTYMLTYPLHYLLMHGLIRANVKYVAAQGV